MISAIFASFALNPAGVSPQVTIYNQGFGFVKEVRTFNLQEGRQTVEVKDVPSLIDATSVGVTSLLDPKSIQVLEQNYRYDLISPQAILDKSVGRPVRFIRTVGDHREVLQGVLLNAPNAIVSNANGGSSETYDGMVIKTDDGRIVLNPTGEVEVASLPTGLISVPTLVWDLNSSKAGPNPVQMTYITQGMSWHADYVLTLHGEDTADLQGWVTLDNQSGGTWENAKLKLLAGDVNQVRQGFRAFNQADGAVSLRDSAPAFHEESLFEYHLYTLQRPATLRNKETKQLSLLEGDGVPVHKKLIIDSDGDGNQYYPSEGEVGTGPLKTQVRLEFTNDEASHLGMPLPAGKVRVYQRDSEGSVQMLGEDSINHTPRNEKISLVVGTSFDVVGSRKRTNFTRISANNAIESFEIEVRNRSTKPETVHVYERHWGDWKITKKSDDFVKLDSQTADFVLNLKPNEVRTISYTVQTRW
jgi:hypothetical protein